MEKADSETILSPNWTNITEKREENCVVLQEDLQATKVQVKNQHHLLR